MCRAPKASPPQIIYQGPSQADLDAQRQSLELFMQQSQSQQSAFSSALQAQIDAANKQSQQFADMLLQERTSFETGMRTQADTAAQAMAEQRQKAQLDMAAQQAAAGSANAALTQSAYGVNTAQVTPTSPQVTQPPQPKERERSTLKIEPGAIEALVGSGLNIGF
jgi:hypothetical protein